MTKYSAGVQYEYQAMKELEKDGYIVTRSAGSHGLFDLIATNHKECRHLQLKSFHGAIWTANLAYAMRKEVKILRDVQLPLDCRKELWVHFRHGGWQKIIVNEFSTLLEKNSFFEDLRLKNRKIRLRKRKNKI